MPSFAPPRLIALLLTLAACSAEPEAQKAAAITVDGDLALLAEPDKATSKARFANLRNMLGSGES